MKTGVVSRVFLAFMLGVGFVHVPVLAAQSMEDKIQDLSQQVAQMSALILELRSEIARSREETRELRLELRGSRESGDASGVSPSPALAETRLAPQPQEAPAASEPNLDPERRLDLLEENQQLLSDRLEEQYQTKVESSSRYRTKLSGIVLLNVFANRGRVDSPEVPDLALRRGPTDTGGTFGLTALQSEVGFETYGPELAGGRISAGLQFDFFGFTANTPYASSWGSVRLRTATVRADWDRTSIVVGQDAPFVSPLSPTSVASLAYPAFSYSGNLWNWMPQARVDHRVNVSEGSTLSIQGGIFDPVPRGSQQPAYGTRLAFSHGADDRPLTLAIGGYYDRQDHGAGHTTDGWAATTDWSIPLGSRFDFSGEAYRGRALGHLGAAQGRSVIFSGPESDPASTMIGVNAIGGWAQLKFKASDSVDFHAAHGEDHPYRSDLLRFIPPGSSNSVISGNRTEMFNVIYRPRTDLLFSFEYRRFRTSRSDDTRLTADHFNLGVGVLF